MTPAAGSPEPPAAGRSDLVFAALADPTRRRILDELSQAGPRSATDLAPGYPMSRQAVVKHLAALADAGLLAAERHGREVRYRLLPDPLADATAWLAEVGSRWDRRISALAHHLDGDDPGAAKAPEPAASPRPSTGPAAGGPAADGRATG